MKTNTGTYEYVDKETGIKVLLTFSLYGKSIETESGTEFKVEFDYDLDKVLNSSDKEIVVDNVDVSNIVDEAILSIHKKKLEDIIPFIKDIDNKNGVYYYLINNNQ